MRFLRRTRVRKTILVISDIHLGAGPYVDGKRNFLEDFHYDKELVDFLEYFSTGPYASQEVELIINGDFFDLLAVPFVKYFDDDFWSEEAALEKLRLILKAHPEVIEGLNFFLKQKNKKIVFIIGNHDAEFIFKSLQDYLLEQFDDSVRSRFIIEMAENGEYSPEEGIILMHGHEYEVAHQFSQDSIIEDQNGRRYFIPPWGSYYVTRVVNKFKEQRNHINAVKPISHFVLHGLIYDTLFTIRFMFANFFYFLMVRFIYFFKQKKSARKAFSMIEGELELFQDYETYAEKFFSDRPSVKALIVGHTHEPRMRTFLDGRTFINTGTWMDMHYLDYERSLKGSQLPFATIQFFSADERREGDDFEINLNVWNGRNDLPYDDF